MSSRDIILTIEIIKTYIAQLKHKLLNLILLIKTIFVIPDTQIDFL